MRRWLAVILMVVLCGVSVAAGAEAEGHALTWFSFTRWGSTMPYTWEVLWEGDACTIREDEGEPRPFAPELAAELAQVVSDYDMESWRGAYSAGRHVLDGESFSLEMWFDDGAIVSAVGNNAFPERYFEASRALDAIFVKEKTGATAGTYKYEGEGFGGDFTITLNPDQTYTFYEGPLSSYMGAGSWYISNNSVNMYEGDGGFRLSFMFGIEDDALIYRAWGSDAFPYVELPESARFVRLDGDDDEA